MKRLTVAALAAAASMPAHAGWQWTKWGMSIEEAHRLAPGEMEFQEPVPNSPEGESVYALDVDILGYAFEMALIFSGQRGLESVISNPKDSEDCPRIRQTLSEVYGTPVFETSNNVHWDDEEHGTAIEFPHSGALTPRWCYVIYTPLPDPEAYDDL